MNELVFLNSSSIPNNSIVIPSERLFGSNKPSFGSSIYRSSQLPPQHFARILETKFSNVKVSQPLQSNSSLVSISSTSTAATKNPTSSFHRSIPQTRLVVPSHKSNIANDYNSQLQHPIDKIPQTTLNQKGSIRRGRFQSLASNSNSIDQAKDEQMQILRQIFAYTEDLITPQQNKYKCTTLYKQSHKSCFAGPYRGELTDNILRKNKYFPGPGDYEVSRMFDSNNTKSTHRNERNLSEVNLSVEGGGNSIPLPHSKHPKDALDQNDTSSIHPYEIQVRRSLRQSSKRPSLSVVQANLRHALCVAEPAVDTEISFQHAKPDQQEHTNKSFMFIKDDRDRFGQQIFPLSSQGILPGPGKYQLDYHSMERKAHAVSLHEQQKRLLKQWLHPLQEEIKASRRVNKKNLQLDPDGPIRLVNYSQEQVAILPNNHTQNV